MRNNGKTLVIDCGGYKLTFVMIHFPMVKFWLLTTDTWFNLKGGIWNKRWRRLGAPAMVVELGWWLGFGFEVNLPWGDVGRCTQAYIEVWEKSERIMIRVRDKT
jgi:hypothetical protein